MASERIAGYISDYHENQRRARLHVERIREYTERPPVQPFDILKAASKACAELAEAIADEDVDAIIAAERRLVAVGGLAQTNANILELGRRP